MSLKDAREQFRVPGVRPAFLVETEGAATKILVSRGASEIVIEGHRKDGSFWFELALSRRGERRRGSVDARRGRAASGGAFAMKLWRYVKPTWHSAVSLVASFICVIAIMPVAWPRLAIALVALTVDAIAQYGRGFDRGYEAGREAGMAAVVREIRERIAREEGSN